MRKLIISLLLFARIAQASLEEAGAEFEKGNYSEAAKLLVPLANSGDIRAQMNLGSMYATGLGVPKDAARAAHWTRRAAEAGNARAQANLGLLHLNGIGFRQSDFEAAIWLKQAAAKGNAGAQNTLGVLVAEGRGVPRDYQLARKLFDAAIRGGEVAAANNLAQMIEQGQGEKPDLKAALGLYEIAAENGDAAAQNRIGLAHLNGELRHKDRQRARDWFQKSASQGDRYGQFHLGMLLADETPSDAVQALLWITLSAKQGYSPAQSKLKEQSSSLNQDQQQGLNELISQWRPSGRGKFDPAINAIAVTRLGSSQKPLSKRPSLGLIVYSLSPEVASSLGFPKPGGAVVASVTKGSTSERAGIVQGDIVLRMGTEVIADVTDLVRVMKTLTPGTNVALEVHRQKTHKVEEIAVDVAEVSN